MESLKQAAALSRVIAMANGPQEAALVLLGEPGIGKTHLLGTIGGEVELTHVLIRINAAESDFPLSGISSVLTGLRREGIAEFGGRFTLRSEEPTQLFAAAHDLIALIQGLGLPPTLLMIDDVDLADEQSRTLLGLMASRLAGTGLRLVMTASTIPGNSPLAAIPTVRLMPVRVAGLVALGEMLAVDADISTLRILAWFAGGNPRILEESLRLIEPEQLHGSAWLMLPPRFNHAVRDVAVHPLTGLTAEQRLILDSLALAPLTHSGAIADAGLELADAVEDLVATGMLHRQGPYLSFHDRRVRSYVYWSSDTHSRRERHATLERSTRPYSEPLAAWHRSFATYDKSGIDDLLAGAAEMVTLRHLDAAVELAERALRKAERLEDHLPAVIELCERFLRAGDVALAARYSARARPDSITPEDALRLSSFKFVDQMFRSQRIADDEVRALVGLHANEDPDNAARLLSLAACFRGERWETDEARNLLDSFPQLQDSLEPTTAALLSTTRATLDAIDGRSVNGHVPPDLDDMARFEPSELLMEGRIQTHREHYDDARTLLNTVLNHPRSVDHIWVDLARYALIMNEIGAGQFRRARAAIESWAEDSPWVSRRSSMYSYILAWHRQSLGQLQEANDHLDQCLELASVEGSPAARARALALRGTMALMYGDPESAVLLLRQVSGFAGRFRNPAMLRHWADYVEACHATGRYREAEGVTQALDRRLAAHESRWGALALARCRALITTDEAAMPTFTAALDMFGASDSPYERARTLSAMADRQDTLALPNEARRTRTTMNEAFDMAGAIGWSDHRGKAVSVQEDDEQSLLALLTDEEIAIARQVQEGLRNREIADSLYLSVRTVELRLTHIYRTLGVRSRSHLVAALARIEAPQLGPGGNHHNS
jgi:DNA-binding CsgD family transcriptional regulator/tetratricopeptide (TPR) repeat protein